MLKNILVWLLVGSFPFFANSSFADESNSGNDSDSQIEKTEENNQNAEKASAEIEVKNAWARASIPSSQNSAAYFEILNSSQKEFVIVSASTTVANNVELHNSFVDEKGVSRMTTIDRVVVPAGSTIEFKPGGMHVMLFNLKKSLNQGDKFNLKLIVENSDPIDVECEVKNQ